MRPRLGIAMLLCLVFAGLVAAPAANAASAFTEVLKDYQSDGKIDPCAHSDTTLRDAANQVPANIEQYAPDFPAALGSAIDKRAQGACTKGGSSGGTTTNTPPPTTTPTTPPTSGATPPVTTAPPPSTTTVPAAPTGPAQTNQKSKSSDSGTSPWLWVAIGAGALALLILAAYGLTRYMGWDGPRQASMRQAWGEAGYRAGGTWADFRDWARFGR
jgi:hypothetical protein